MTNIYRETIVTPSDRLMVALDNMRWERATQILDDISPYATRAKVNSLAQKTGWEHAASTLIEHGFLLMADPKYHDTPETVGLSVNEAAECGPEFITVHASGGPAMLKQAVKGRDFGRENITNPILASFKERLGGILAVTVLTSHDEEECVSIYGDKPERKVVEFAHWAVDNKVDGIVCSAKEVRAIRAFSALRDLVIVVPAVTTSWAQQPYDQKRITTPTEAMESGADFVAVGRAITTPPEGISTVEATQRVLEELAAA